MSKHYLIMYEDAFLASTEGSIIFFKEDSLSSISLANIDQHFFLTQNDCDYYLLVCPHADARDLLQQQLGDILKELTPTPQWKNLRSQLSLLSEKEFQLVGRAQQILRFYDDHQFCGRCGTKTNRHSKDLALRCEACKLDFYPRLSPCIMVLVTRGNECLLAHHARSQSPRYSCLAGFIEAGESPEQTLVREVMEEVGLKVHNLRYFGSQPWPFPGQLMLGYTAEYLEGNIVVDGEEILAADWFSADNLPEIPPAETLSGRMIRSFCFSTEKDNS